MHPENGYLNFWMIDQFIIGFPYLWICNIAMFICVSLFFPLEHTYLISPTPTREATCPNLPNDSWISIYWCENLELSLCTLWQKRVLLFSRWFQVPESQLRSNLFRMGLRVNSNTELGPKERNHIIWNHQSFSSPLVLFFQFQNGQETKPEVLHSLTDIFFLTMQLHSPVLKHAQVKMTVSEGKVTLGYL